MPTFEQPTSYSAQALDVIRDRPLIAAGVSAAALAALGALYYRQAAAALLLQPGPSQVHNRAAVRRRSEAAWTGNPGRRQSSPTQGTPGQRCAGAAAAERRWWRARLNERSRAGSSCSGSGYPAEFWWHRSPPSQPKWRCWSAPCSQESCSCAPNALMRAAGLPALQRAGV